MPLDPTTLPHQLLIDGRWEDAASGKTFETVNPATGRPAAAIAEADAPDVERAVAAARRAFDEGPWPRMAPADRQKILWRMSDLLERDAALFAEAETLDTGKTITESSKIDVPHSVDVLRYYAGWATKLEGETIPVRGAFNYTLREPLGVVGAITPWNFPLNIATWKIAPALAAGNTVVHKPAEQTPLTALLLGKIALEAGLPEGVLNVVPGFGPTAGAALVRHPAVDKIAFTGETTTGQTILREAAGTLKRVSVELGGKSANIVFADADIPRAARAALSAIFYNKGEVCSAGSRLLVERSVEEAFLEAALERAASFKPGDPMHPKTRLGPVVSEEQLNRVLGYVRRGVEEGARLRTGGQRARVEGFDGYFVEPTVFDRVANTMTIAREEIFGPVLSVIPFDKPDEAAAIANDSPYGLAAAVWTRDLEKAHRTARALRAGTVWINTYNLFDPASPFGGYKMSGFGRDLGRDALLEYTQVKSVWIPME